MKLFRKTSMLWLLTLAISFQSAQADAKELLHLPRPVTETSGTVSPCADPLEWVYKVINGKLYRRLFNRITNQWVGDWELVS